MWTITEPEVSDNRPEPHPQRGSLLHSSQKRTQIVSSKVGPNLIGGGGHDSNSTKNHACNMLLVPKQRSPFFRGQGACSPQSTPGFSTGTKSSAPHHCAQQIPPQCSGKIVRFPGTPHTQRIFQPPNTIGAPCSKVNTPGKGAGPGNDRIRDIKGGGFSVWCSRGKGMKFTVQDRCQEEVLFTLNASCATTWFTLGASHTKA